jgi:hypothetical protein
LYFTEIARLLPGGKVSEVNMTNEAKAKRGNKSRNDRSGGSDPLTGEFEGIVGDTSSSLTGSGEDRIASSLTGSGEDR